jgi:hypothetical protein
MCITCEYFLEFQFLRNTLTLNTYSLFDHMILYTLIARQLCLSYIHIAKITYM